MNGLFKNFTTIAVTLLLIILFLALTGCAGTRMTAGGIGAHGAGMLSYEDNGSRGYATGGGYRTAPCQPFRAEELMAWATELESSHQKRSAQVTNSNGRVSCYSSESAGSQSGNRQQGNVYRQPNQLQPQYRQAPMDGVKYQQVEM